MNEPTNERSYTPNAYCVNVLKVQPLVYKKLLHVQSELRPLTLAGTIKEGE